MKVARIQVKIYDYTGRKIFWHEKTIPETEDKIKHAELWAQAYNDFVKEDNKHGDKRST